MVVRRYELLGFGAIAVAVAACLAVASWGSGITPPAKVYATVGSTPRGILFAGGEISTKASSPTVVGWLRGDLSMLFPTGFRFRVVGRVNAAGAQGEYILRNRTTGNVSASLYSTVGSTASTVYETAALTSPAGVFDYTMEYDAFLGSPANSAFLDIASLVNP